MANTDGEVVGVPNIRDTVEIPLECRENGRNLSIQLPPSIYMVPRRLRDLSPGSFETQMVSIGPRHRDDELVQEFEEQKAFLQRSLTFHELNDTVVEAQQRIRQIPPPLPDEEAIERYLQSSN
ncbi:hypothetical protein L6452_36970 [Arctium lappa]|uniref:Uncharacterized protein n=1 Tax=Arctium lappa TaxID=4217 RepID=A0ACB8Y2V2_ARCLA|nr:hypothetical protein L6452_36970 [Arctium lappa]